MISKVDWLSISIKLPASDYRPTHTLPDAILDAVTLVSPQLSLAMTDIWELVPSKGRAPFSVSWQDARTGMRVFAHPLLDYCLFELGGQACDDLAWRGLLENVVQQCAGSLTRLDIASDIQCETNPLDFVVLREQGRFKAHSEVVSASGTTAYVGSRSSDRYARVYRYNPPHERSHLLRIEHVVKGENAKSVASDLLAAGVVNVVAALGSVFSWGHPDWKPEKTSDVDLKAWRPERHKGKTTFWLNRQVAPALIKLAVESGFDVQEWLDTYVKPYTP